MESPLETASTVRCNCGPAPASLKPAARTRSTRNRQKIATQSQHRGHAALEPTSAVRHRSSRGEKAERAKFHTKIRAAKPIQIRKASTCSAPPTRPTSIAAVYSSAPAAAARTPRLIAMNATRRRFSMAEGVGFACRAASNARHRDHRGDRRMATAPASAAASNDRSARHLPLSRWCCHQALT